MQYQKHLLASALTLAAGQALAIPFSPIDARSLSMGGAGVANARASSAGMFNPAMLSEQKQSAKFSIVLPSVGLIVDDRDDLINTVKNVQDGSLKQIGDAIDTYNRTAPAGSATPVGNGAQALAKDLPTLNGKPVNLDVGAGFGFGVPGKKLGVGVHVTNNVSAGVMINVNNADITLLNQITNDASDGTFTDECASGGRSYLDGTCHVLPTDKLLQSSVTVVGVGIAEAGVSFAHEFNFGDQALALGITPKFVKVDTINYRKVINSNDQTSNILKDDRYRKQYDDFNFDLGAAKVYGEEARALTVGLMIRNVIPHTYQTAADPGTGKVYDIAMDPQVRTGVSKRWGRFSAAADLDITRNKSAGLTADSQFLGGGVEMDWRVLQLRAGYRYNLVSNGIKSMATAGLGLGPLDITAMYADQHSAGVDLQLGFSY